MSLYFFLRVLLYLLNRNIFYPVSLYCVTSLVRDTESCVITFAFVWFSQKPVWYVTFASTSDPLRRTRRKQRGKGDNTGLNLILNDKINVFLGFYPLKQQH